MTQLYGWGNGGTETDRLKSTNYLVGTKKRKRSDKNKDAAFVPMRDTPKLDETTLDEEAAATLLSMGPIAHPMLSPPVRKELRRAVVPLNRFQIERKLADSLQGSVNLAVDLDRDNRQVALKISSHRLVAAGRSLKGQLIRENFLDEIKLLCHLTRIADNSCSCGANGFARVVASGRDGDNVFLASEFCDGGEMFDMIGRHEDYNVRGTFRKICETTQFLHTHNVAHRDMSLENVMLNSSLSSCNSLDAKIIDFGVAIKMSARNLLIVDGHFVGKLAYASPQIHNRQPYNPFKADVWSLGVMLVRLLFGNDLYSPTQMHYLKTGEPGVRLLLNRRLRIPNSDERLTDELVNLLAGIFSFDESSRFSIEEVLAHPWFS